MQTFLPWPDFDRCAAALDRQRLGKQRVECLQILTALTGGSNGWRNHPAVKMWRGYEGSLLAYMRAICKEWTARGYRDTCLGKANALGIRADGPAPPWMGDGAFHLSHRSNLLRKDLEHYGRHFESGTPADLPYVWPVK